MKEVELSQGKVALVDDEDFERVSQFKWYAHRSAPRSKILWYAVRSLHPGTMRLHTFILPGHPMIDHRDNDGLNCQKSNLRPATVSFNNANRRKHKKSSSKFKGVTWYKAIQKWQVAIGINGKRQHLGYFFDETEAACAYDTAAKKLFGEFARLNFPE